MHFVDILVYRTWVNIFWEGCHKVLCHWSKMQFCFSIKEFELEIWNQWDWLDFVEVQPSISHQWFSPEELSVSFTKKKSRIKFNNNIILRSKLWNAKKIFGYFWCMYDVLKSEDFWREIKWGRANVINMQFLTIMNN